MNNLLRFVKVALILGCFAFVLNIGGIRENNVLASDACVTRSGGNNICDCVGDNCGKVCSRSISLQCQNGTCKDSNEMEIQ